MIGQTWPAERRSFRDPKTGRQIEQLTSAGNNVHLYFTENAFDTQGASIIFRSDRASAESRAPHEDPHYNIFRMDLASGAIVQLTDEPHSIGNVTKTPDSQLIVYIAGDVVRALDARTGAITTLYQETNGYTLGSASIAADRRYVGFARNERVEASDHGPNYSGFKERYYAVKDGRITIAYLDGSGHFDAFVDTHQLGHFQFSPDDSTLAMFCHEGPWNLVTQRMWGIDLVKRAVWPYYRQTEQDSIGHEFWTHDGLIFFDDRGPDHDGTITSDRTQAVVTHVQVNENALQPFVGLLDRQGNLIRRIDMPYYCNHYHANPASTVLVGDDVDELVLIDIGGTEAKLDVLCQHGTSWYTQTSHCHPTWSWDGRRILYASDTGGRINLYLIEL
jgi:oligogalacturonide lyase